MKLISLVEHYGLDILGGDIEIKSGANLRNL